jgi:mannose-6-phosphate isomerase-like protein (cupin superfamily)
MKPDRESTVRVEKPWGHELIWARTERYVGKILFIRRGESLSLQYHRVKEETLRVLSGLLRLETRDVDGVARMETLEPEAVRYIPPGLRHRMEALEDTEILEVSTPELDDVVRLEDRYGRVG